MSLLHLHCASVGAEGAQLSVLIKPIASNNIAEGTDDFVATVLSELELDVGATGWRLTTARSSYFGLRPETGDWGDACRPTWWLQATLASARPTWRPPAPVIASQATDGSWRLSIASQLRPTHALVVALFRDAATRERGRAVAQATAPVALWLDEGARFPQLIVDLGVREEAWFAAGALEATELTTALADLGASVHEEFTEVWTLA